MKTFLRIIRSLLVLAIVILVFLYHNEIAKFIISKFIYNKDLDIIVERNEYAKSSNYQFVQITDDFQAKDFQHLLNIFYTMLDSGQETFSFFCSDSYKECQDDIFDKILTNKEDSLMAEINNFVHPYNTYKSVNISSNDFGKITITITKQYSQEKITYINNELERIKKEILKDNMATRDKILAFHDYVVNNTTYDHERAANMTDPVYNTSTTHTAYGLLETKKALCGGYSDIMAIFLSQLEIDNINISGNSHVWNLLYVDNGWFHLDVTWDDPVTNTGDQFLLHDYFLITTAALKKANNIEHQYKAEIYIEAS